MATLLRKGHFLGAKLRSIRKRNGLTLEELSTRCIQRDVSNAPSVSYLSMIESGKRAPSPELLELLAAVFQRDPGWFLDESADIELSLANNGGVIEADVYTHRHGSIQRLIGKSVPVPAGEG